MIFITEIGLFDHYAQTVYPYASSCTNGCGCGFEVTGSYRDDYCLSCT